MRIQSLLFKAEKLDIASFHQQSINVHYVLYLQHIRQFNEHAVGLRKGGVTVNQHPPSLQKTCKTE